MLIAIQNRAPAVSLSAVITTVIDTLCDDGRIVILLIIGIDGLIFIVGWEEGRDDDVPTTVGQILDGLRDLYKGYALGILVGL